MIGEQPALDRNELPPQRVLVGPAPVDQADEIRRQAHAHRRGTEAKSGVAHELRRSDVLEGLEQALRARDRMTRLPGMVEEYRFVDFGVGRNPAPEFAAEQLLVDERGR